MENENHNSQQSPFEISRKPWHPKLTPYRVAVLSTTLVLGTAKAVVTQKEVALVSTTLEWVAGTLLALIFFSLSAYDSRESVPPYLAWVFKPDCMELVWKILTFFSIKRPEYVSNERSSDPTVYFTLPNPDITLYRILVCGTVTAFGTAKAMLGYFNKSAAATWTDWAIAVPLTSLLYVLGLYEYNSSDILPGFFSQDQSAIINSANQGIMYAAMYAMGLSGTLLWTVGLAWLLYGLSTSPNWKIEPIPEEGSAVILQDYVEYWQAWFIKLLAQEGFGACVGAGLFALVLLLKPAVSSITARFLRATRRLVLRVFGSILSKDPVYKCIDITWKRTTQILRVAFHLIFFTSGIVFMVTSGMACVLTCIGTILRYGWKDIDTYVVVPMSILFGFVSFFYVYRIGETMIGTWPTMRIT